MVEMIKDPEHEDREHCIDPTQNTLPERRVYNGIFPHINIRQVRLDGVFPKLAKRQDIKDQLQNSESCVFFTGNFIAEAYPFDDLLRLDPKEVALADLLFNQHRTRYPSPSIIRVNLYELMKELEKEREEEWTLKEFKRRYNTIIQDRAVGVFSSQEKVPDFSSPEATGPVDPGINLFLALHLALDSKFLDTPEPLKTIEGLTLFAGEHNLDFDSNALREAFADLVSEKTITYLINQGILESDKSGNFYENVADLMAENSLLLARQHLNNDYFLFPYPTGMFSEASLSNPDYVTSTAVAVDFLPHLFGAYLNYLARFHEVIKEGESFDPLRLRTEIQRLFRFSGEALYHYMHRLLNINIYKNPQPDLKELFSMTQERDPSLAKDIALIYASLQQTKPYFEQVLAYYKSHPQLLNKSRPDENFEAHVTSYRAWREEILQHGGKPSQHTHIQFRHDIRKNQV